MAECFRFVCSGCGNSIEAWSDGNPFYIDEVGNKKYAYHPNHDELEKCIANDEPHLSELRKRSEDRLKAGSQELSERAWLIRSAWKA